MCLRHHFDKSVPSGPFLPAETKLNAHTLLAADRAVGTAKAGVAEKGARESWFAIAEGNDVWV